MAKKDWDVYFDALRKQDWEKALESLHAIQKTIPKDPQIHLKIGDVFQKTGNVHGAVAAYHQGALLFMEQGFLQKALAIYKIILRLDPHNAEVLKQSKELIGEIEYSRVQPKSIAPLEVQEQKGVEPKTEVGEVVPPLTPLLAPLPEKEWKRLLERIQPQLFQGGQTIVEEGDFGDSIFLITSGHAKVVMHMLGKEIELATLSAGDIFGEVAFLTGRPRTASVVAIDTVKILEFNRLLLEELFEKNPEVLKTLHDFYQCRVRDTLTKVKSGIKK